MSGISPRRRRSAGRVRACPVVQVGAARVRTDRRRAPAAGGAAVSMRRAGAATPASQASARAPARAIPAVGARGRPAREARLATRASTTRRARARDAGLALLLHALLRGRGDHPILRGVRSHDNRDPDGATHVCGGTATVDYLPANPPLSSMRSWADRKYVRYTFRAASERRSGQVWNPPLLMRRVEADGMADCALQCWKTCLCSNVLSTLEQACGGA